MKIFPFDSVYKTDCAFCLGRFDGLHIGHRKLVERAKETGFETALFTIKSEKTRDIFTFEELVSASDSVGVRSLVYATASPEFFDTLPDDFLDGFFQRFSPKAFVCGKDFTYGRDRLGNVETLKNFCVKKNVPVYVVDTVTADGVKISSRDIKAKLLGGDIVGANALLGEKFSVEGVAELGRGDGARLGFKTANVVYSENKTPVKQGVYATQTAVDGKVYDSLTNYGTAPTFGFERVLLETHILGFDGDLHGKTIRVFFTEFLREDEKFSDKEQLIARIKKDIEYYD